MTSLARAFVAVVPPPGVLAAVAQRSAAARDHGSGWRWTGPDQWHLTLQFLGPVADLEAVEAAARGALAPLAPVELRLGGGGAFPSPRRASVLWIGVVEGAEALGRVAVALGEALAPLGHPPDDRRFHPHLTLARLRRPGPATRAVEALGTEPAGPRWRATELVLFESITRDTGAEHRVRARLPLDG